MSEEKLSKQGTPPPLLLMGASKGLTLDPPQGGNMLLAVPQTDASLFPSDDGGEEDSFIGQTQTSDAPFTYFQQTNASDPFASVGQPSLPAQSLPSSQAQLPHSSPGSIFNVSHPGAGVPPPVAAVAPLQDPNVSPLKPQEMTTGIQQPPGATLNFHRPKGPLRYAQPPAGTYAPPLGSNLPPTAPFVSSPSGQTMVPPSTTAYDQLHHQQTPVTMMNPQSESSSISVMTEDVGMFPPASQQTSINLTPPATSSPVGSYVTYIPVQYHWFYKKPVELRMQWIPFSIIDSNNLEQAFRTGQEDSNVVSTDGGRYDVNVIQRSKHAIYWEENPTEVRRCSWFYRPDGETRFVPYDEGFAEKLEEEYKMAITTNLWHKKLEFPGGETIVMHNPSVIVNFSGASQPDQWGNSSVSTENWNESYRPRVVKRGAEEAFEDLQEGEPSKIDHVVFMVHGIGSTCDLRFRNIVECVNDFRAMSMQMLRSHFKQHQDEGRLGRVEFLPVRWHNALHGDASGVDQKLRAITLNSIGKLRHFTNDTLLDILFYSSPTYAQQIADTVGAEINRLYSMFMGRNPTFKGNISVSGHSLGALILFDLLTHQKEPGQEDLSNLSANESLHKVDSDVSAISNLSLNQSHASGTGESTPTPQELNGSMSREEKSEGDTIENIEELLKKLGLSSFQPLFEKEHIDLETLNMCSDADIKEMGLPLGPRKKLQGYINSQKEKEKKDKEELAAKLKREAELQAAEQAKQQEIRQEEQALAQEIADHSLLPSAAGTSVNYVVGVAGTGIPFVKYPQLEFQPSNFFALGSPIAMFLTVRGVEHLGEDFKFPTCQSFFNIFHPFDPVAYRLEPMIVAAFPPKPVLMPHHMGRKRLHLELKESIARMGSDIKHKIIQSMKATWKTINDFAAAHRTEAVEQEVETVLQQMTNHDDDQAETESIASSMPEDDLLVGNINQGRRIDYVLQEKPIESFNDYLFALGSHGCYWESEDTVLMLLKEIYALYGFAPSRPGKEHHHSHSHFSHKQPVGPPPSVHSAMGQPPQNFAAGGTQYHHPPPVSMVSGMQNPIGGHTMGQEINVSTGIQQQQQQTIGVNNSVWSPALPVQNQQQQQPVSTTTNFAPPPLAGFVPRM